MCTPPPFLDHIPLPNNPVKISSHLLKIGQKTSMFATTLGLVLYYHSELSSEKKTYLNKKKKDCIRMNNCFESFRFELQIDN